MKFLLKPCSFSWVKGRWLALAICMSLLYLGISVEFAVSFFQLYRKAHQHGYPTLSLALIAVVFALVSFQSFWSMKPGGKS